MSMYNELLFVQRDDSYNIGVELKKTTGRDPLEEDDPIEDWLAGLVGAHCTMHPDYHRHEDTWYFGSKGIDPHEFLEHYWYKLPPRVTRSFQVFYRHEGSDMWVPVNVVDDHEQDT